MIISGVWLTVLLERTIGTSKQINLIVLSFEHPLFWISKAELYFGPRLTKCIQIVKSIVLCFTEITIQSSEEALMCIKSSYVEWHMNFQTINVLIRSRLRGCVYKFKVFIQPSQTSFPSEQLQSWVVSTNKVLPNSLLNLAPYFRTNKHLQFVCDDLDEPFIIFVLKQPVFEM